MAVQDHKILITGASGLLGRAIYKRFDELEGYSIYGIAFTRVVDGLHKVDITQEDEVRGVILKFRPDLVVHAAAQRFPDRVQADPEAARVLNVYATQYIVDAAREVGAPVLYISTDYVFDGKKGQPYTIADEPNPVNLYGKTKLQGETVTLKNPGNIVLRVPVLYGPVTNLQESAVTCLLQPLLRGCNADISHVERRCPSHINDVALICSQLATARLENDSISGIFQWCGEEKMTKYEMAVRMAEALGLPHAHLRPSMQQEGSATRPLDTELDRSRLARLGFGQHTPFSEGIKPLHSYT